MLQLTYYVHSTLSSLGRFILMFQSTSSTRTTSCLQNRSWLKMQKAKCEVVPGLEPGLPESESEVITATLHNLEQQVCMKWGIYLYQRQTRFASH